MKQKNSNTIPFRRAKQTLSVIARRNDEAISVQEQIASLLLAMTKESNNGKRERRKTQQRRIIARNEAILEYLYLDCFVPRNDEQAKENRHCEEARRSNLNTGMDCFVPRNQRSVTNGS
ncbi:MAG: hypothetical protein LBR81_09645 [Prevotellaceae bacterium]|nr:hypothetical protein [Prevotellaceae bacterium]